MEIGRPKRLVAILALGGLFSAAGGRHAFAAPRSPHAAPASTGTIVEATIAPYLSPNADIDGLKRLGPGILPVLASMYERSGEPERTRLAGVFYGLGMQSADAKRVLMRDVHTANPELRLQVQWALGRVSNDDDVVDVLLENMQDDSNPLFRDKAACALAHDQIFLTDSQKIRMFERLIGALDDPKPQVRQITLQVLQIHTGQTKGFDPNGAPASREAGIRAWRAWLQEYRASQ
jgi:HEAT repeat protein